MARARRLAKKTRRAHKRKQTRRLRKQRGGARIGGGAYGDVFWPTLCPLPAGVDPRSEIGKLIPYEEAAREHRKMAALRAIPGFADEEFWTVQYNGYCTVNLALPDLAVLPQAQRDRMAADADQRVNPADPASPFKSWKVLRYPYAGVPLNVQAATILLNHGGNPPVLRTHLKALMQAFYRPFYGILRMLTEYNLVHRDIKPENICCELYDPPDGRIQRMPLIDFGLCVDRRAPESHLVLADDCTYRYWPLESIVTCSRDGLLELTKTDAALAAILFTNRPTYLGYLNHAFTAATAVGQMRAFVYEVIRDELQEEEYEPLQGILSTPADPLTFVPARFAAALAAGGADAATQELIRDFHTQIRARLLYRMDLFSLGITLLEVLIPFVHRIPNAGQDAPLMPIPVAGAPEGSVRSLTTFPGQVHPPADDGDNIHMAYVMLIDLAKNLIHPNGRRRLVAENAASHFATIRAAYLMNPEEEEEAGNENSLLNEEEPNLSSNSSDEEM